MFERFSATARQAVVAAREEARTMNHPHIGGEHLLIGLAGQGTDPAAVALRKLGIPAAELRTAVRKCGAGPLDQDALALVGIDLESVKLAAEARFGPGALDSAPVGRSPNWHIPFDESAKTALQLALRQAVALRSGSISSGHLLLGVVGTGGAGAARLLAERAVDLEALRADTVALIVAEAA